MKCVVLADGSRLVWKCEDCPKIRGIGWEAMMQHMKQYGHDWFEVDQNLVVNAR